MNKLNLVSNVLRIDFFNVHLYCMFLKKCLSHCTSMSPFASLPISPSLCVMQTIPPTFDLYLTTNTGGNCWPPLLSIIVKWYYIIVCSIIKCYKWINLTFNGGSFHGTTSVSSKLKNHKQICFKSHPFQCVTRKCWTDWRKVMERFLYLYLSSIWHGTYHSSVGFDKPGALFSCWCKYNLHHYKMLKMYLPTTQVEAWIA